MHIAMWSGPRNLSTAMMYSFAARSDMAVMDEPFYGAFLDISRADHPMWEQVIASMELDPARVIGSFQDAGAPHLYTKQMTHHMLPEIPRDWIKDVVNVFLIRHPARVIASYSVKRDAPTLADIGFSQQLEIYEALRESGVDPVVIDSFDVRQDPERTLGAVCDRIGLNFDPEMLRWPAGGHSADGVWAAHWYGAVHQSTGFAGPEGPLPQLEGWQAELQALAMPAYETLAARALKP